MPDLEIVCLANSRKHGGRCVAGWRTDGGGFVRLVASDADGTLTALDMRLDDGSEPRMFDLLRIGVVAARPLPHQPENWVIDESPWRLVRRPAPRATLERMLPMLERGPSLLGGTSPAIRQAECGKHPVLASLAIVRPVRATLIVAERMGKKRLRARFPLRGTSYELTVTDPLWEAAVAEWQPGEYSWWQLFRSPRPPVITVSLTAPFGEAAECFKIAATVWPGPDLRDENWPRRRAPTRRAYGRRRGSLRNALNNRAQPPVSAVETSRPSR